VELCQAQSSSRVCWQMGRIDFIGSHSRWTFNVSWGHGKVYLPSVHAGLFTYLRFPARRRRLPQVGRQTPSIIPSWTLTTLSSHPQRRLPHYTVRRTSRVNVRRSTPVPRHYYDSNASHIALAVIKIPTPTLAVLGGRCTACHDCHRARFSDYFSLMSLHPFGLSYLQIPTLVHFTPYIKTPRSYSTTQED